MFLWALIGMSYDVECKVAQCSIKGTLGYCRPKLIIGQLRSFTVRVSCEVHFLFINRIDVVGMHQEKKIEKRSAP